MCWQERYWCLPFILVEQDAHYIVPRQPPLPSGMQGREPLVPHVTDSGEMDLWSPVPIQRLKSESSTEGSPYNGFAAVVSPDVSVGEAITPILPLVYQSERFAARTT